MLGSCKGSLDSLNPSGQVGAVVCYHIPMTVSMTCPLSNVARVVKVSFEYRSNVIKTS